MLLKCYSSIIPYYVVRHRLPLPLLWAHPHPSAFLHSAFITITITRTRTTRRWKGMMGTMAAEPEASEPKTSTDTSGIGISRLDHRP